MGQHQYCIVHAALVSLKVLFSLHLSVTEVREALMWFVVPESLLDYRDYQQWVQDVAMNKNISFNPQNEVQFNVLSQQAWTHLLMQIIKVHVCT